MRISKATTPNVLYTIIGNTLVLGIIGLFLLGAFLGERMIDNLSEQFSFELELRPDLSQDHISDIKSILKTLDFVDPESITFKSKDQLAEEFIKDLDLEYTSDYVAEALFSVIRFSTNDKRYNSADVIRMKQSLSDIPTVQDVMHVEDFSKGLLDNMARFRKVGFLLSLILCFILTILIYNNTRLSIYSERFKIYKMQLVGAVPWFITKPFVNKAIRNGLMSGIIAILIVGGSFLLFGKALVAYQDNEALMALGKVAIFILMISITISAVSSYVIVNRYLRMDVNQLYR